MVGAKPIKRLDFLAGRIGFGADDFLLIRLFVVAEGVLFGVRIFFGEGRCRGEDVVLPVVVEVAALQVEVAVAAASLEDRRSGGGGGGDGRILIGSVWGRTCSLELSMLSSLSSSHGSSVIVGSWIFLAALIKS